MIIKPADPEGEGSSKKLSGKDAENGREETEQKRSGRFKEDSVGQAKSDSECVKSHENRNRPNTQPIRPFSNSFNTSVFIKSKSVMFAYFPYYRYHPHYHSDFQPFPHSHFSLVFLLLFSPLLPSQPNNMLFFAW